MHPDPQPLPTALETARALAAGSTSVIGLVEQALARISSDRQRPEPLDAWAFLAPAERLRARAAGLDDARRAGLAQGLLAGIPMGIKDLLDTRDVPTEAGSARWRGRQPACDAPAVAAVRTAGGLLLGKTRTHEFGAGVTTPPTRNPFDPSRIPGGSSGGSAAAVAAGQCFWAIGTDTLGSVRMPAALCGVVGLKPTMGSISTHGVVPLSRTLDHVGVLARDCTDAATAFSVLAGPHRGHADDGMADRSLRIGFVSDFDGEIESAVVEQYERALQVLQEDAGAELRAASLQPMSDYVAIGFDVLIAEAAAWHAPMLAQSPAPEDDYQPDVRALLEQGTRLQGEHYERARERLRVVRAEADALFEVFDVLVTPAVPFVAPAHGATTFRWPSGREEALGVAMPRFTAWGNVTGLPAVSVPVGLSDGLPVGVQLIARADAEFGLLRVAARIAARLTPNGL